MRSARLGATWARSSHLVVSGRLHGATVDVRVERHRCRQPLGGTQRRSCRRDALARFPHPSMRRNEPSYTRASRTSIVLVVIETTRPTVRAPGISRIEEGLDPPPRQPVPGARSRAADRVRDRAEGVVPTLAQATPGTRQPPTYRRGTTEGDAE